MRYLLSLLLLFATPLSAAGSITHLTNIYRAPVVDTLHNGAGVGRYYSIKNPQYLAAMGNYLFFSQAASSQIFRYDLGTETITIFDSAASHLSGGIGCLMARPDLGFYLCDQAENRILSFDANGRYVLALSSFGNLANPVGIVESPNTNNLFVVDGLFDHVVIFSPDATPLSAFGNRGTESDSLFHIQDITSDDSYIYILDRLNKYVKRFNFIGTHMKSFQRSEVIMPTAIALDSFGRSYIADEFDDSIKVYYRGRFIESIGGTGDQDGKFRKITDLAVNGSYLYVADSNNNRIQLFVINAPGEQP